MPATTAWPTTSTATTCPTTTRRSIPGSRFAATDAAGRAASSSPATADLVRPHARLSMAFPYVFPGAYSRPQTLSGGTTLTAGSTRRTRRSSIAGDPVVAYRRSEPLAYLQNLNHNPLDLGDNLPTPPTAAGSSPDLVGLPDLARDALAVLDRPHRGRSTCSRIVQPFGLAYRGGRSAHPGGGRRCSSCPDMQLPRHLLGADCRQLRSDGPPSLHRRLRSPTASALAPAATTARSGAELGRRPDHDGRAQLRHQGLRQRSGRLRRPGLGRRSAADQPLQPLPDPSTGLGTTQLHPLPGGQPRPCRAATGHTAYASVKPRFTTSSTRPSPTRAGCRRLRLDNRLDAQYPRPDYCT